MRSAALTPKPATIATIRERHEAETRAAVLAALQAAEWSIKGAAQALAVPVSSLQRLIDSHGLTDTYAAHSPGRGRPRVKPSKA